jgi:hypothetical protein
MDELKARKIAAVRDWIDAWNAHDVERVLGHYAENVVLVAEGVRTRLGRADGTARGKDELRDHFRLGLARDPEPLRARSALLLARGLRGRRPAERRTALPRRRRVGREGARSLDCGLRRRCEAGVAAK